MPSLQTIETWMLHVITRPDGIASEGTPALDASSLAVCEAELTPRSIVRSTPEWSCEDRLAVYWNAYYLRLQACLREDFPALCAALGEELFDGFVVEYLQAFPPCSDTLADLGSHLSDYLRLTRPPREADESRPDWADFLVDLAHLERTISEVFDGPGSEGTPRFDAAGLAGCAAPEIAEARLRLTPSLRLEAYRFPVHEYQSAVRRQADSPVPEPRATCLAVARRDFRVQCHPLDSLEFALLGHLQNDLTLADACRAATRDDVSEAALPARIASWFQRWTRVGWIDGVTLPTTAAT